MMFRKLKADEISVKVKQVTEKPGKISAMLLLYKDARVDMAILDETVGPKDWQNEYSVIKENLHCTVSIWDKDKSMWIHKSNVGTESDTEAEKGEASDAFKRACTNWGIGRELYSGPPIWVDLYEGETYKSGSGKLGCKARFSVSDISYDDNGDIEFLSIADSKRNIRFSFGNDSRKVRKIGKPVEPVATPKPAFSQKRAWEEVLGRVGGDDVMAKGLFMDAGAATARDITEEMYQQVCKRLDEELDSVPFGEDQT
jgi:hypothetical protein